MFKKFKNNYIFIFVIFLFLRVTILLFSNTFYNKFVFSDHYLIGENYLVRSFSFVSYYFQDYLTSGVKGLLQPITMISYNLNYLIHDYQMWGYHAFNIFLQSLNVFLLFLIILKLTGQFGKSFLLAILFLVHPINNETVNHLMDCSDLFLGLFLLLSFIYFLYYLRSRRRAHLFLSLLAYLLALGSKENAFLLLPLLFFYLLFFERRRLKHSLGVLLPFIFLSLFWIFYTYFIRARIFVPSNPVAIRLPQAEHLLATQFKVFFFYLRLFFIPWGYNYLWSPQPFDLWFWVCWILWAWLLFFFWRGNNLVRLGLLWMFIFHSWKFFIPLVAVSRERHFYLSSFGLILVLAGILPRFSRRGCLTFGLLLSLLGLISYSRNFSWRNELSIFRDVLAKYLASEGVNYQLVLESLRRSDYDKARAKFGTPLEIARDPQVIYKSLLGLAEIYLRWGNREEVLEFVDRAIKLYPRLAPAYELLEGIALKYPDLDFSTRLEKLPPGLRFYLEEKFCFSRGDYAGVRLYLRQALKERLDFWRLFTLLGKIVEKEGNLQEVRSFYREAFRRSPFNPELCFNLGTLLQSFDPQGVYFLKWVIKMESQFAPAYYHLDVYYLSIGRKAKAADLINRASYLDYKVSLDIKQLLANGYKM